MFVRSLTRSILCILRLVMRRKWKTHSFDYQSFFLFFFTKICSMTLLWSITIMILFCFCCLSICCLPQYTCTYVYKFTLALSHFHCCHSRHTVPYNYYTYKLGSYGCTTRGSRLTPILYTLPRTKRWVREFRMGMLCVYVWVCKVCISNRLLCFILLCFFFILDLVWYKFYIQFVCSY